MGEAFRARAAASPVIAHDSLHCELPGDSALDKFEFSLSVAVKSIDGDDDRHAELSQIGDVPSQIGETGFERRHVLRAKGVLGDAAMHFKRPHRSDEHRRRRYKSGLAALMSKNFSAPRSAPKPASVTT